MTTARIAENEKSIASLKATQRDGHRCLQRVVSRAGWNANTQRDMNLAWFLPRPKPDKYRGGMPLYAEEWLLGLAMQILGKPDAAILNLFCGMNRYGLRVDVNEAVQPDVLADAHEVSKALSGQFDIILADPPYSTEEAKEIYGTPPLKYKRWTGEADKLLRIGGLMIVYHKQLPPNPNPSNYRVVKRVFLASRANHLPRVAVYFQKHSASTANALISHAQK